VARFRICIVGLVLLTAGVSSSHAQPARPRVDVIPVDASLQETLKQYATAFQSLDPAGVKKVQPSVNVISLQNAFKEMRALEVTIDEITVLSQDDAGVRVSCRVRQTLTPKAGSRKSIDVIRVIRLRKQNDSWVIDAFER